MAVAEAVAVAVVAVVEGLPPAGSTGRMLLVARLCGLQGCTAAKASTPSLYALNPKPPRGPKPNTHPTAARRVNGLRLAVWNQWWPPGFIFSSLCYFGRYLGSFAVWRARGEGGGGAGGVCGTWLRSFRFRDCSLECTASICLFQASKRCVRTHCTWSHDHRLKPTMVGQKKMPCLIRFFRSRE